MNEELPISPIRAETQPKLATRARVQTDKVSGKPAILYPEGVLLLNPTGAAIVELCDGQRTIAEIADTLAARYGATASALTADIIAYLERLRDRGLLDLPTNEITTHE